MFQRHRNLTHHLGRPASFVWQSHLGLCGRSLLALICLIVLVLGSLPLSPVVARAARSLWPDGAPAYQWDSPDQQPAALVGFDADVYATTYVVRRGDNLTRIARRFGTTVGALAAANHLASLDFVYSGERLIIRSGAPAPAVSSAPDQSAAPPPAVSSAPDQSAAPAPAVSSAPDQSAAPAPAVSSAPDQAVAPAPAVSSAPDQAAAPAPAPAPVAAPTTGRWIDVDLTHQVLVAYEGTTPVFTTLVSSGLPGSPTVIGTFHIYVKYLLTLMVGPGYYLPNVPYTMYFYQSYGIHGTYWHHNFGHPMSHGCVNVSTPDAAWLYGFASVGTPVVIHQ